MKDLLTGKHMLFTELQNFAAFKSYRILKFGKLVGSLIKKDWKIEFLDVLRIFELLLHLESNLAEIYNIASIYKGFSKIFSCKIGIQSKVDNIFQKNAPDFLPLCVEAMFQISARLDFKCKSSLKICKTSENSIFASFFIRNPTNFPNFKMRQLLNTAKF